MTTIRGHGLAVDVPDTWEGRIYRRNPPPDEPGQAFPIVHVSNFTLPRDPGDFGSGAITSMGPHAVFVALLEYGPGYQGSQMFRRVTGPPGLSRTDFSPRTVQVFVPGSLGKQEFFELEGRTFCLYVVAGSDLALEKQIPAINAVVASLRVARVA